MSYIHYYHRLSLPLSDMAYDPAHCQIEPPTLSIVILTIFNSPLMVAKSDTFYHQNVISKRILTNFYYLWYVLFFVRDLEGAEVVIWV